MDDDGCAPVPECCKTTGQPDAARRRRRAVGLCVHEALLTLGSPGRLLVVAATPLEARGGLGVNIEAARGDVRGDWVLVPVSARADLLLCGVGKVNAGAAVARCLRPEHALVVNIGIAGALPGSGLQIGEVLLGTRSVYADEGIEKEAGDFQGCAGMGFPLGPFGDEGLAPPAPVLQAWREGGGRAGVIATVSTCSGRDARAAEVVRRTGAVAEAMEGAACGHVAARLGRAFAEVRAISNTTGNRAAQRWDIPRALVALREVLGPWLGIAG